MCKPAVTAETIKQRLIDDNRTVSLLYYAGKTIDKTSQWKCHDCGHKWTATAGSVVSNGNGCKPCGIIRRTNDQKISRVKVEKRLKDEKRPISLLSLGKNANDKSTRWKCHDCDYEWDTTTGSVLNGGTGCPSCSGLLPLTQEMIEKRLEDGKRPITLLFFSENANDKTSQWKCHDCGHKWTTTAGSVLSGTGCTVCAGNIPMTMDGINQKLKDEKRPITLSSFGKNVNDKTSQWKCHDCGYKWTISASNILGGTGCSACAGLLKQTPEMIDKRLIDTNRPITLLFFGENANDKTSQWKCHDCGHTWNTSAASILNNRGGRDGGTGCSSCADYGFNPGKPAYFYLNKYGVFTKSGIAGDLDQRHGQLDNQTVDGMLFTIESSMSWYFEKGSDAAELEDVVLKMFEKYAYAGLRGTTFDGRNELFENAAHQKILNYIAENYDISYV